MSDQPQRLWYTSPQVKRNDGRIARGSERFRICAVTPGLNTDIYAGGAQVRALERYTRYTSPNGTTRDDASLYGEQDQTPVPPDLDGLRPNDSPICLSLIDIQNPEVLNSPALAEKLRGRVLVNKVYLGTTSEGREGNFFVDLLSHLPDSFSAREALALWRSNFWQRLYYSDTSNLRYELPPVALPPILLQEISRREAGKAEEKLPDPFAEISLSPETMTKLKKILTFLIHAYLLQQHEAWTEKTKQATKLAQIEQELAALRESKSKAGFMNVNINTKIKTKEQELAQARNQQFRPKQIYLAAEDDQVAYCLTLLASLFQNIPALLQPLTFSTYEYDVLKSECLIVATSPSRAWEENRTRLDSLLPPECEKSGLLYNTYNEARNTRLPQQFTFSNPQNQLVSLPLEAIARDLAHNLLKPSRKFFKSLSVAAVNQLSESALSPVFQFVSSWQKHLAAIGLSQNRHLTRAEVERFLTEHEWQDALEEPVIRWKVLQWVVADCKGFDLDRPQSGHAHPPFASTLDSAGKLPAPQTLLWLEQFCQIGDPNLIALLASSTRACLEAYADNRAQSEASFTSPDHAEIPESELSPANKQPPSDLILFCQQKRDPEPFMVLLNVLQFCELPTKRASSWTTLLEYLLARREQGQRMAFEHSEAGAFVLRHLYNIQLSERARETHKDIHNHLLLSCTRAFSENRYELVAALLEVPLSYYWDLLGSASDRQNLYLSWRKGALLHQLNRLTPGAKVDVFTNSSWETYHSDSDDIKRHRELLKNQRYYLLLVTEAIECLDDWKYALPLLGAESPPFQAELIHQLEKPERVRLLQRAIQQQMSTKPENKDVVIAFYEKLLKCGYSEAPALLLLDTWHEIWYQGYVSNEVLRDILNITTNLSQTAIRDLLLLHKEAYKAKQAEVILVDLLYKRYIGQGSEERWLEMLFELFEGQPLSQDMLDALLPLARLSTLGKVEFFARFGPTYLSEYFHQPRQGRSKELLKLFTSLLEEHQDLQNQALRSGQSPVPSDWYVLLVILSLWLTAVPLDEIYTIQFLINRAVLDPVKALSTPNQQSPKEPAREDLASILATFGAQYMASGKRELRAMCEQVFQWLSADGKLSPALKLQMCLTLLPPDLFPFTSEALSLSDTLQILKSAQLAHEHTSPFVNELRKLLADQKDIAQTCARQLFHFLKQQGRSVDLSLQKLQAFLAQSTRRTTELADTVEAFLRLQVPAGTNYQPSELEFFLEIQEYRGKARRSETFGPPLAIYLYYLDSPERERAELFRNFYQRYLRNMQIEHFEQRQGTLELLESLSGTPKALDKSIHTLGEGLLTLSEFLQTTRLQHTKQMGQGNEKPEKNTLLSKTTLKNLRVALYDLKRENFREAYYQQIADSLVLAIVQGIASEFDIARVLNLELGHALFGEEKSPGFALLVYMSVFARAYYRTEPKNAWWLPYLLFLPALEEELAIQGKEAVASFQHQVLDALLLVNDQPDEPTVLAVDSYVQRAAAGNMLTGIVDIWENYKPDPKIRKLLTAQQQTIPIPPRPESIPADLSAPVEAHQQIPNQIEPQAEEPTDPSGEEKPSKEELYPWLERFQIVRAMRNAIKNADRPKI